VTTAATAAPAPAADQPSPLWTRAFVQVCIGGFLSYASQSPITPVIALWVVHLGGSATTVGLVAAAFSAPSFILRPWVGKLCDSWSARGVFAVGCIISGLGSLIILIPAMAAVFVSQVLNGIGWAGLNTGGYTMVAEMAPPDRRGAASSYLQMSRNSLGFYLPYLALKAKEVTGFWLPFLVTGIAGLLAAPTVIGVPERKRLRGEAKASAPQEKEGFLDSLFDRDSLLGTAILFFAMITGPAINVFIVLYGKHLGLREGTIAQLLLVRGAFSIASQGMLAGLSDRVGRGRAVALGLTSTAASMLLLSAATGAWMLLAAMIISTVSGSLTAPALQALAIDRSDPNKRGKAMATFSLSFQMGSFVGGLIGGLLIDALGYRAFYAAAALPSVVAAALLFANWQKITAPARPIEVDAPA
jgi:MFS family permease